MLKLSECLMLESDEKMMSAKFTQFTFHSSDEKEILGLRKSLPAGAVLCLNTGVDLKGTLVFGVIVSQSTLYMSPILYLRGTPVRMHVNVACQNDARVSL